MMDFLAIKKWVAPNGKQILRSCITRKQTSCKTSLNLGLCSLILSRLLGKLTVMNEQYKVRITGDAQRELPLMTDSSCTQLEIYLNTD